MKKRILIIEDEKVLRETLEDYLREDGFDVKIAMDGEIGMNLIKEEEFDLIVLDIILPKKDGFKILEEVKEDEKRKNIPVIILTNLESVEDIQKAFERGVTNYLVKSDHSLIEVSEKIKKILKI
ncbi:MAG: response regulator [Candidatus Moranbacteria bacterium CG08_land_8_20_14_0_20_34_16]|nr:MAG: response regulator [Candidatus Moranbacteria bacterium CG08_land_8_20_14_0_20_34_16]